MDKIKIILADDHHLLRYGLRTFLEKVEDVEIVGEASTGCECITLFKEQQPDLCILDINMPNKNGIEAARAIRNVDPEAKLMFLSMHSDNNMLQQALSVEVNSYLSKSISRQKILETIRRVMKGERVFDDFIPDSVLDLSQNSSKNSPQEQLTKRETEIVALVVDGHSSPEIAKKLFISRRTVDTHRNNIMQKLDVNNTASLVRLAIEHNLDNNSAG